jgi:hypothetical protein
MKKRALLLGVGAYLEPIPKVSSAQNDIKLLAYKLSQLSFEINIIFDCTYEKIENSIAEFFDNGPCDSTNIVYFTGHGYHEKGINYIVPIDFNMTNGYKVDDIIHRQHRNLKKIVIIDACRDNFNQGYEGNYSPTFALPHDTYIAYASQFGTVASYTANGLSYFTESICDNILFPNLTVNEMFENVRHDLNKKGYPQISNCMSGLRSAIILNESIDIENIDQIVYEYIEENAEKYERESGYIAGEYDIFIDAAQRFNIPLLDTYYNYSKVQSKKYNTHLLHESESKLITFFIMKASSLFSIDENYTWFFKGRKVRMGEIPPLPKSMERLAPIAGKGLKVTIDPLIHGTELNIKTNLPNGFVLQLKTDGTHCTDSAEVEGGICRFTINESASIFKIISPVTSVMENLDKYVLDEMGRNLVGDSVSYDPIFGCMINLEFHRP